MGEVRGMKSTPKFAATFAGILLFDLLLMAALPLLVQLWFFILLWLILGVPVMASTALPTAIQWMNKKRGSTSGSSLTKLQCGGGLWFLIWCTVYHSLEGIGEDAELWQIYIFFLALLQLLRLFWFGVFNVLCIAVVPFFGNRLDKLCIVAGALTSAAGLYLWNLHGTMPQLPQQPEQYPFFLFMAVTGIGYGLVAGGFLNYLFSLFQPPTETAPT